MDFQRFYITAGFEPCSFVLVENVSEAGESQGGTSWKEKDYSTERVVFADRLPKAVKLPSLDAAIG